MPAKATACFFNALELAGEHQKNLKVIDLLVKIEKIELYTNTTVIPLNSP